MADPYKFSGQSGLFFDKLYDSQAKENRLEKAMAQVCPCLFYFDGKCKIRTDLKTPCVGAKINCDYYTNRFEYLTKEYVKDGKGIFAEHIVELFKFYLKYPCSYEAVSVFATEAGVSSYWQEDRDYFGDRIILPKRIFVDAGEILSLPYHPQSTEYKDYLSFVTDDFFKFLFPRVIYPLDVSGMFCQNNEISVLLDVPGGGCTYIIYISELNLSDNAFSVIDEFFKTGVTVGVSGVQDLTWFFKEVFDELAKKQNNDFVFECDKIGFGVNLATLSSKYDLSKCLIIYSESSIIFNEKMFNLNKVFIGMLSIDEIFNVSLDMSYCDVSFASNCIYDLATDYTLDVSYKGENPNDCPNVKGDYKGQDLSFGVNVSAVSTNDSGFDEKTITMTALPLPWYYSDETTKKYLWTLSKKEEKYKVSMGRDEFEKEFDFGKIIFFKNVIILWIKDAVFPFYIKECTYNAYKYKTKYQAYHPMLENYDIDSAFSFSLGQKCNDLIQEEIGIREQPNPDRSSPGDEEEKETQPVTLLKSLSTGTVILVPDVEEYVKDFGNTVDLEFTLVKGDKIEYLPEVDECRDENLFIPNECNNVEFFNIKDLSSDKGTCEEPIKVEKESEEKEVTIISLSELIKNPFNSPYYVQVVCDLEVDEDTGVTYKQEDIKSISYFYFSYLSFKFLFESFIENESDEEPKPPDYENSDIQKLLRGERPLLTVDDLSISQEKIEGEGEEGQEAYVFKYLYEKTVRSFVNNKFYEPFSKNALLGLPDGIYEDNSCFVGFSESVSDFYILKELEDAKKPIDPDVLEPPVKVKHDLTHILDVNRFFGLPICGFNKDKLKFDDKCPEESEESIFDKLIMDNFESEFNEIFYFYILGISKFVQDYLFFVKHNNNIMLMLKRIPVIVSQVGLPDPEIKYKWKSECNIYTYLYDTGLNPFTKLVDSNNLNFFINPFYVIVHKNYRDDKYEGIRTATNDYGYLFSSGWWPKYKKNCDSYGYFRGRSSADYKNTSFLDVYKTLANLGDKEPSEKDITNGFIKGKSALYIQLESISYVYSSYCGDHDFSLGDTTPYLYDRAADTPLSTDMTDPLNEDREISGVYYTGDYDKNGIGMRRSRPCSRFVGHMWFPFRACEVARYNEFVDYPGVRHFITEENQIYRRILRGFSCTDLIFKSYNDVDIEFSDFKYLFIDDCFGSINPYRYSSSFYSVDTLHYYEGSSITAAEVAPTYLASNASVPWRFMPILFDSGDSKSIVIVKPREYMIEPVASGIVAEIAGAEKCVVLDISTYKDFNVGLTGIMVTKDTQPESGAIRSILYNCLIDIPPMLPYNYDKNKYVCGYERMRGGDANFIYQCLYPYHHVYPFVERCKFMFDYKNKGEEAYGLVENTLLPHVMNISTTAEMIVDNSILSPGVSSMCPTANSAMGYDFFKKEWCSFTNADGSLNTAFWEYYDEMQCETDGPDTMKMCLNLYTLGQVSDYSSRFIDKNSDCCDSAFMLSDDLSCSNSKIKPLYYHFASDWKGAYDYVFLGAAMKSKPTFYGDGALRVFKNYEELKKSYFIFDSNSEVNNVAALPIFGGLGKFFRMCYFSTYYGKIPFSTLSGVNTTDTDDLNRDDNYVYKLSGHTNSDVMFDNDFEYGYLPEKSLVFVTDDFNLFDSMFSFTNNDSIILETRNCVRFGDLAWYKEATTGEKEGYYKYEGGNDIEIVTFGNEPPVESGPALAIVYDTNILAKDKYSYYSEFGFAISLAEPIVGDMGIVVDPFPFGERVTITCQPLQYNDGYLMHDYITLKLIGLGCCPIMHPCYIEIKIKEKPEGELGFPWIFYIESEESVVGVGGSAEVKTIEVQKAYLCYDDRYKIGQLIQRDNDDNMSLNEYDVVKKGDMKYKINRGFYIDFSNMFLPHSIYTTSCLLQNLKSSSFSVEGEECCCVTSGLEKALYINLSSDCFIISLKGGFFSSSKWTRRTAVGYLCLETSEEYYAVGNLIAKPKLDHSNDNVKVNGKYRYELEFEEYDNYNKIKYGGTKYRFIFSSVMFFCDRYGDRNIDVEYGRFNGGTLCEVMFNKVSSLKAITYSKSIEEVIQGGTEGINLYYENLNDKLTINDNNIFYVMPFGFVHKLSGGILEDKEVEFKEGYSDEFSEQVQTTSYSEHEQKILDRITLSVERDVFKLIHYPTCFIRFCLKSKLYNISSETYVSFDADLVPNLCNAFGYIPISQWVAPGHRLDLYPDSFYTVYFNKFFAETIKIFANTSCLDLYKNNLDILSEKYYTDYEWKMRCNASYMFEKCGSSYRAEDLFNICMAPYNSVFITHVDHGMFGYPDIVDVSDWIEFPFKATVYGFYDKYGDLIQQAE